MIIDKINSYVIRTFRTFHPNPLHDFCTRLKKAWVFELEFLREHNVSDPSAYHSVCWPLCNPHSDKTFPRRDFFFLDLDRRGEQKNHNDPMIYIPTRLRENTPENDLNIFQLHHHLALKTPTCLLHNIYEVIQTNSIRPHQRHTRQ